MISPYTHSSRVGELSEEYQKEPSMDAAECVIEYMRKREMWSSGDFVAILIILAESQPQGCAEIGLQRDQMWWSYAINLQLLFCCSSKKDAWHQLSFHRKSASSLLLFVMQNLFKEFISGQRIFVRVQAASPDDNIERVCLWAGEWVNPFLLQFSPYIILIREMRIIKMSND